MALTGKIVYIAGSGIIGSACAREFLKAGAKVWMSSRNQKTLDDFKSTLSSDEQKRMGFIIGQLNTENECAKIRNQILSHDKKIDHVVAALGGFWMKGVLSDQSIEEFDTMMHDMAYSHFIVYKTYAKKLAEQPGATYTFISGGSGEECEKGIPMEPKISLLNACGITVYGLYNAAYAEFKDNKNLSINQLRIFCMCKPVPDATLDQTKNVLGNDLPARMVVMMAEKHLSGLFRVEDREKAAKEIQRINRVPSAKK